MNTITIDVDSRLVRIVCSPAFSVVASLRGVCVSFAPALLYWSGQGKFFHGYERFIVPACFAVIFLVVCVGNKGVYEDCGSRVASDWRSLSG